MMVARACASASLEAASKGQNNANGDGGHSDRLDSNELRRKGEKRRVHIQRRVAAVVQKAARRLARAPGRRPLPQRGIVLRRALLAHREARRPAQRRRRQRLGARRHLVRGAHRHKQRPSHISASDAAG